MSEFTVPGTVSRLIRPIKRNDVKKIINDYGKNTNNQLQLPNIPNLPNLRNLPNINLEKLFSLLNMAN